jgi:hypothetical protein
MFWLLADKATWAASAPDSALFRMVMVVPRGVR